MKKNMLPALLFALISCSSVLSNDDCSAFKVRAGVFVPQRQLFRRIYGKATGIIDVELSTALFQCVDAWINIDALFKKGRSVGFCSPTKIAISHISFGFKVPYEISCLVTLYAGLGASFAGTWIKNKSLFCCDKEFKGSAGVTTKSGAYFFITDRGFLDLFFDYLYQPTTFTERKINLGGAKIGLGGGFTF